MPALGARIAVFSSAVSAIVNSARPTFSSPSVRLGKRRILIGLELAQLGLLHLELLLRAGPGGARRFKLLVRSAAGPPRGGRPVDCRSCVRYRALRIGNRILVLAPLVRALCRGLIVARALAQRDLRFGDHDPRPRLLVIEPDQQFAGEHLVVGLRQNLGDAARRWKRRP